MNLKIIKKIFCFGKSKKFLFWSPLILSAITCHALADIPFPAFVPGSCKMTGTTECFEALKRESDSLPLVLTPSQTSDVSEFCRINGFRDTSETPLGSPDEKWDNLNAWSGNFAAAKDHRDAVYKFWMSSWVVLSAENSEPLNSNQLASCKSQIEQVKLQPMQQNQDADASSVQLAFLCEDVTLLHISSCSNSIKEMVEIVKPRNDMNLIDVWFEVLSDPSYLKVMKKVALRNHESIMTQKIPETRFFDDLKNAFNSELHDQNKAIDHTFKLLGILSSNGGNSAAYIPCHVDKSFKDIMKMLSLGSEVLDRSAAQKGFLYTYPKEVDSICDYGKNYHFWMSAFLAREAVKKSGDIKGAAAAAFTLNKGYQFLKKGAGRDPTAAFKEDTFSNYNNNMRLDLTQSAAGAWFGATSLKAFGKRRVLTRQQFEAGLFKVFDGSIKQTPTKNFNFPESNDSFKIIETYLTWKKILNPDGAYKYFEAELLK